MEERETMDFGQLLADNIGMTGTELKDMETGSTQRLNEAKIFDMQAARVLEEYQKTAAIEAENERLGIEKLKLDEEITLKRDIEEAKIAQDMDKFEKELEQRRQLEELRLKIEEKKAKHEIWGLWAKVVLAGIEVASAIGLGLLYLKVNLSYGGLIGKDGKKFWDEIKHIKLM